MHKSILFGDEARQKLLTGINTVADVVKITMGANGRTVMFRNFGNLPKYTKDGVTAASQVSIEDPAEATGAMVIFEAARKTVNDAGDGTTATCVLMQQISQAGVKAIANGSNSVAITRGIQKACDSVIARLKTTSIEVLPNSTMLLNVATIAANNDKELGSLISDVFNKLGADAIITVGEPLGNQTETKISKGLRIPKGYANPHFINNRAKQCAELENSYVLIYENKIGNPNDIFSSGKILDVIARQGKSVLVMCDAVDDVTLSSMVASAAKGAIKLCYTGLPSVGEDRKNLLEDIAAATGATICGTARGIKATEIKLEHLGVISKVTVTKDITTFFHAEDANANVTARIDILKEQLATLELDNGSEVDRARLQHRIASLGTGVATIHVGGNSQMEVDEKKDRVDDAIRATQAALQEGVLTGGGIALFNASSAVYDKENLTGDKLIGFNLLIDALTEPLIQIATNCGESGTFVAKEVCKLQMESKNPNIGYNALTDTYEDLSAAGVLDAFKVVRCALENATTQSIVVLSTESLLTEGNPKT